MNPDDPGTGRTVLPTAPARDTWRALVALARPHRRLVAAALLVLVAATSAALAIPRLLGEVVDVVDQGRPAGDLDRLALALVAATVAQGVLGGLGSMLVGRTGEKLLAGLREQVVERALQVPLAEVERGGTGDVVARACGDVDTVSEATREALPEIVSSLLIIGLTVVGLATIDWRLAVAGMLAVPVQATASRWYLRRSGPIYAAERAAEGMRSQEVHSSVEGARTIRSLRLGDAHVDRIDRRSAESVRLARKAAGVRSWFFSRLNVAELLGLGAVLVAGFLLVRGGTITVGAATAGALYFHRLFDPIGTLLFQLDTAQEAGAALARLVGVTSLPAPVARDGSGPQDASVRLEDVRFGYDRGDEVLHGVTLHLAPGERVALVGESGAGKTTIAKLVAGIHEPLDGRVRLGGWETASLVPAGPPAAGSTGADGGAVPTRQPPGTRGSPAAGSSGPDGEPGRTVTLISQEVHVFTGTLADDLRLARPEATEAELHEALARVGADGWVRSLPDGLDTVVSEGPHKLGPTRAQQLGLARLVLTDPAVAVLDEATAEAGSAGARTLEASADAAIEGRTALVVAHRLTQAVAADRIVVLDEGRVVQAGAHEDLLAEGGPYADLWAAWSAVR